MPNAVLLYDLQYAPPLAPDVYDKKSFAITMLNDPTNPQILIPR